MVIENSDKNKQYFFAFGSSSVVCRFPVNVIASRQNQISGKLRPEVGDGSHGQKDAGSEAGVASPALLSRSLQNISPFQG